MWSFYDNLSAEDIISRNTSKPERGLSILKRTLLLILISPETAREKTSAYLMRMRGCDQLFNILLDSAKRVSPTVNTKAVIWWLQISRTAEEEEGL